jgi:hypothetical protein
MQVASPSRKTTSDNDPLGADEALMLLADMRSWYYQRGQGMFLTHDTQQMFVEAERRLNTYSGFQEPMPISSDRIIRDLSLLRTQMKGDTKIYGANVDRTLEAGDTDFLHAANIEEARWLRPRHRWMTSPRFWAERRLMRKTQE